jgi:predicted ATP-grasp superfamily ATP-dependent carboligase
VPRVLIFEFVTGGGFAESNALPPVLSEAYAMLSTLLKDFSYNAGCEAVTILDKRLAEVIEPLAAGSIMKVSSNDELERSLRSVLRQVDAALVVAPETDGILSRITGIVEDEQNRALLGSSSDAVNHVSDKGKAIELARSLGIPVPQTSTTTTDESEAVLNELARDIGFPVVIKPNNGAGSEGIFVVEDRQDLSKALKIMTRESPKRRMLIQEYVKGVDASVSVLTSGGGHTMPLSLNRQFVEVKSPRDGLSSYEGGYTPFEHPLEARTFECARRLTEAVSGLKGYVGIDFVLTEDGPTFMEVNARITTSYTGLSRVLLTDGREGVASAIIDCVRGNSLPSRVTFKGLACYSKFKLSPDLRVDRDMIDVLSNLEYVESPPFSMRGGEREAFLVNVGESLDEARAVKSRNEKKFRQIAAKLEKH